MMKNSIHILLIITVVLIGCDASNSSQQTDITDTEPLPSKIVQTENPDIQPIRIAFGSCSRQDLPQVMWRDVLATESDIWIWLGDNIYGDTRNMDVMRNRYMRQKSDSNYTKLRANTAVVGIWDDHDYGINDGGKEYPYKDESKALMLEFLDVPKDNPVRKHKGAYNTYTFGQENQKVKVILLDGRYFRDELLKKTFGSVEDGYNDPNLGGDILGEEQWKWFENQLTNSDADIHLIGCGTQMLPQDHAFEHWGNFPKSRKRLLELLQKTNPKRTILLSGDRHLGEMSKLELDGLSFPLYEITSSGLTHAYEGAGEEPNRHRVGNIVANKNFGLLQIEWNKNQDSTKVDLNIQIRGLDQKIFEEITLNW